METVQLDAARGVSTSTQLTRCPACVSQSTPERLYLAQQTVDTRQLPQDIQPAIS